MAALTIMVDQTIVKGADQINVEIGALVSSTGEHVSWKKQALKAGDEVRIKVIQVETAETIDEPDKRYRRDPKHELDVQKRYVRQMARKFGWEVTKRPSGSRKVET